MKVESHIIRSFQSFLTVLHREALRLPRTRALEPVHRIRVTSRRLRNALKLFKPFLPIKDFRQSKKDFKTLGRACSDARDLDVHILFIKKYFKNKAGQKEKEFLTVLIKDLARRRKTLQSAMEKAVQKTLRNDRLQLILEILQIWKNDTSLISRDEFRQEMKRRLKKQVQKVLNQRRIVRRPKQVEALHHLRIDIKHVRYSLELLEGYYGTGLRRYIDDILKLHYPLGAMHDYDVLLQRLAACCTLCKSGGSLGAVPKPMQQYCEHQRAKEYRQFVKTWDRLNRQGYWKKLLIFIENDPARSVYK